MEIEKDEDTEKKMSSISSGLLESDNGPETDERDTFLPVPPGVVVII
jgi:hypothetical protein